MPAILNFTNVEFDYHIHMYVCDNKSIKNKRSSHTEIVAKTISKGMIYFCESVA